MEGLNRRAAMRSAGALAASAAALGGTSAAEGSKAPKLWTLEGELKVYPKFIYR